MLVCVELWHMDGILWPVMSLAELHRFLPQWILAKLLIPKEILLRNLKSLASF